MEGNSAGRNRQLSSGPSNGDSRPIWCWKNIFSQSFGQANSTQRSQRILKIKWIHVRWATRTFQKAQNLLCAARIFAHAIAYDQGNDLHCNKAQTFAKKLWFCHKGCHCKFEFFNFCSLLSQCLKSSVLRWIHGRNVCRWNINCHVILDLMYCSERWRFSMQTMRDATMIFCAAS